MLNDLDERQMAGRVLWLFDLRSHREDKVLAVRGLPRSQRESFTGCLYFQAEIRMIHIAYRRIDPRRHEPELLANRRNKSAATVYVAVCAATIYVAVRAVVNLLKLELPLVPRAHQRLIT